MKQDVQALATHCIVDARLWAHAMVRRYGRQSIAYQTLLPGVTLRAYLHLPALVGYVERRHTRIVVGLPMASLDRRREAIELFEHEAAGAGCRVCYFGVEEEDAELLDNRGRMRLGAQPVWIPSCWTRTLETHPSIRAQIRRARNKGVEAHEWPVECVADSGALRACLRDWLSRHTLPPMHFLVEPDILAHLYDRRVFVAERAGIPVAFLIATPIPKRKGWLVEQLVRSAGAPNGTSELLLDALMGAVRDAEVVSLGLTPLTLHGKKEGIEALWLRWVVQWARAHGRRFYNFHGIEAFRARLAPDRWENVYAVVNAPQFTPKDLFAILAAFTQEPLSLYLMRALMRAAGWEWRRMWGAG
ncbi:MAG TPA: phosphatidylglycerol lysyltransferase domain-containing protein [Chthonomonas sp.]|uniref:phosphatidylglycerol lysyltransferase domain-containing protein n=1 Tax=Chthonomonas sp. TaxID=2282153 RepID=UPI002B4AE940|nr:phosphatidylglycerol lysyltransferase domain-containing protein [Chthonomonas sp.]HLI47805.1 phosphatidylglycerol lysyltransferase domain-containing protein [Chthonomonas sp.]